MSAFQRVVFDTSTLVSAALRVGSTPHQALAHVVMTGEICVSASMLDELDTVLMRPKFDRYQPAAVRAEFVAFVRQHGMAYLVSTQDEASVSPPSRDAKDNQFLALLRASNADVLISSDADLLVLNPWNGLPILTPREFLDVVINES